MIVLALLAITGGALAYQNYTTAQDWKDRALATEDELEQTSADLERTSADLEASEEEVDRLEGRLNELSAEKAQAEDQREVYRQLAGLAATVADELDRCITAWESFTQSLINLNAFNYGLVEAEAQRAGEICGQAKADNQQLTRIINSLI